MKKPSNKQPHSTVHVEDRTSSSTISDKAEHTIFYDSNDNEDIPFVELSRKMNAGPSKTASIKQHTASKDTTNPPDSDDSEDIPLVKLPWKKNHGPSKTETPKQRTASMDTTNPPDVKKTF